MEHITERATFGAGCFWCIEAMFASLKGVTSVQPGYSGGQSTEPTYKEVCSGDTGHAEVVEVLFDPNTIRFVDLLEVFFQAHDPTTLNRQGNDIGTQYRSAIFYHTPEQKQDAIAVIKQLTEANAYDDPIVTEVTAHQRTWIAEDYHHDYLENNPENTYCSLVVKPKLEKFRKVFADRLKD